MKQIGTLIFDDEPAAIDVIRELSREFAPELEIKGTADNGLKALQMIAVTQPELVFLDIDMPRLNGLQVLEKLNSSNFLTIITTGSSSHAFKALKLDVVDYLLKPIDTADFITAVGKVRERLRLHNAKISTRKIQLPTQNEIVIVEETSIIKVVGKGSYCEVFTTENQKLTISKNLGLIEQKLSPEAFFRCHNSYIINLHYIDKLVTKDGFSAVMKDGSFVEISRRAKDAFLKKLSYTFHF